MSSERKKAARGDKANKGLWIGAGAALGSAALAAAVLYASRARDRQAETPKKPVEAED